MKIKENNNKFNMRHKISIDDFLRHSGKLYCCFAAHNYYKQPMLEHTKTTKAEDYIIIIELH